MLDLFDPAHPVLTSSRLELRGLRRRDQAEWFRVRSANESWLRPWEPTSPLGLAHPAGFRTMVRDQQRMARAGTSYFWAVTLPVMHCKRPPIIGQISVSGVQYGAARNASIGYWIDRSHAGQGLTPEATALVADYCFSTLHLHRLEINIRPENSPSLRVPEKLGFRYEGVRKAFLHIDGAWRDHRTYALTAEERSGSILESLF